MKLPEKFHPGFTIKIARCFVKPGVIFMVASLSNCPSGKHPGKTINSYLKKSYTTSLILPVYIATNRAGGAENCSNESFQTNPNMGLRFYICPVSVPRNHSIGSIDSSESSKNMSTRYYKMGQLQDLSREQFFSDLSAKKNILVFVHGFNVDFEQAVLRASQIAYDVKFPGQIVLYSWPAGSASGILDQLLLNRTYSVNRSNASQSVSFFQDFLYSLSKQNKNIQLVIHSMGHQVVLPALIEMNKNGRNKLIDQLILNAPDFATSDFINNSAKISKIANRVTLYCSPGDNALLASVQFNHNHRIGLCTKINGIDVINVNEIDQPVLGVGGLGHGYYSGRAILTDLFQTLLGIDVEKRLFIRRSKKDGAEDFILRK